MCGLCSPTLGAAWMGNFLVFWKREYVCTLLWLNRTSWESSQIQPPRGLSSILLLISHLLLSKIASPGSNCSSTHLATVLLVLPPVLEGLVWVMRCQYDVPFFHLGPFLLVRFPSLELGRFSSHPCLQGLAFHPVHFLNVNKTPSLVYINHTLKVKLRVFQMILGAVKLPSWLWWLSPFCNTSPSWLMMYLFLLLTQIYCRWCC